MTTPAERLQSWTDEDPDVAGEGWPAPLDVQAVLDELKVTRAELTNLRTHLINEVNRHADLWTRLHAFLADRAVTQHSEFPGTRFISVAELREVIGRRP